jgi:hypothetical protein
MPLMIIREWTEATVYLTELRDTVRADVRPLLATPGYAPFAISREVFCLVDHLGHLYTGGAWEIAEEGTKKLEEELMAFAAKRFQETPAGREASRLAREELKRRQEAIWREDCIEAGRILPRPKYEG